MTAPAATCPRKVRRLIMTACLIPRWPTVEVQLVERYVPVGVEDLEAALFFFQEPRAIREQPLDDLVFARGRHHRGRVLVSDLDREGPVGTAVPVIGRHERPHG